MIETVFKAGGSHTGAVDGLGANVCQSIQQKLRRVACIVGVVFGVGFVVLERRWVYRRFGMLTDFSWGIIARVSLVRYRCPPLFVVSFSGGANALGFFLFLVRCRPRERFSSLPVAFHTRPFSHPSTRLPGKVSSRQRDDTPRNGLPRTWVLTGMVFVLFGVVWLCLNCCRVAFTHARPCICVPRMYATWLSFHCYRQNSCC